MFYYSWKSRYILAGTLRRDASSKFGKNNRWGWFPSVSAAWRVSDEFFMKWTKPLLSDAKIRVSYGVTGNDKISAYEAMTTYTVNGNYNNIGAVVGSSKYGNPNLKWEETKQTNFGLDLSFLDGRIYFTGDYYIKKTHDLLADQKLPSGSSGIRRTMRHRMSYPKPHPMLVINCSCDKSTCIQGLIILLILQSQPVAQVTP